MPRKGKNLTVVTAWTNGRKAEVHLVQDGEGAKFIKKVYRHGWRGRMFRECMMAAYVSGLVSISPRVLAFRPWRNEIVFQYLPGASARVGTLPLRGAPRHGRVSELPRPQAAG